MGNRPHSGETKEGRLLRHRKHTVLSYLLPSITRKFKESENKNCFCVHNLENTIDGNTSPWKTHCVFRDLVKTHSVFRGGTVFRGAPHV